MGRSTPGRGAALVFVALTGMGIAFLTPCILLPEWHEYQSLQMAAQVERHELDRLNRLIHREQQRLEALCSDPAVVARLAQRDLRFQRRGTRVVAVSAPSVREASSDDSFRPIPAAPPRFVGRWLAWLPAHDYGRIFCDDEPRTIVMVMSLGLIMVALAVFRPQRG